MVKKENRELNISRGKEAVERELKRLSLTAAPLFKSQYLDPMLKRYGFAGVDEMYAAIGFGGITAAKVVARLRDSYAAEHKEERTLPRIIRPQTRNRIPPALRCAALITALCAFRAAAILFRATILSGL